jgi:L-iditol 2-dehydrogenase
VGLCGSDLHWFERGAIGDARLVHPLILGHEFCGRLDDGQLVVADPAIPCGTCGPCTSGDAHLCLTPGFAGHGTTDGGLRSSLSWPARLLRAVPESIGPETAALLEPLGVALHAVDLAAIQPGERALVVGCGPIGLLIVRVLRSIGVGQIFASEPLVHRLAAAIESGAIEADGQVLDVDIAFEAAGTDGGLAASIDGAQPGGRIVLVGIPSGDRTTFRAAGARRKELSLRLSRRMRSEDLDRAIALVTDGKIDLDGLITHRFPLDEAPAAFATLAARSGIKVLVQSRP